MLNNSFKKTKTLLTSFIAIIGGDIIDKILKIQDLISKFDKQVAFFVALWLMINYMEVAFKIFTSVTFWINFMCIFLNK